MADLKKKIDVEFQSIQIVIDKLKKIRDLNNLSEFEIAGVAAYIHNFYNGMENILKQILKDRNIAIPDGSSWHRDLVYISSSNFFLSKTTEVNLIKYLSFRHYFVHNYAIDLDAIELELLVQNIGHVFDLFKNEILAYIEKSE